MDAGVAVEAINKRERNAILSGLNKHPEILEFHFKFHFWGQFYFNTKIKKKKLDN